MTTWAINDRPIVEAILESPEHGAWWADVAVAGELVAGPVVVVLGLTSWHGAVIESRRDGGRTWHRVVGGAGGLSIVVPDRWQDAATWTLEDVLRDIARLAGEAVGDVPDVPMPRYTRRRGTAGAALDEATRVAGVVWRIGADGEIAVGVDRASVPDRPTWVPLASDATSTTYAVHDVPDVGTHMTVRVSPDGSARATVRNGSPMVVDRQPTVQTTYRGSITAQNGSNVDVAIGNRWTLSNVPLWLGLPGLSFGVPSGTECLVTYLDDDPRKPVAIAVPYDTNADDIAIDAAAIALGGGHKTVLREGDQVTIPGVQAGGGVTTTISLLIPADPTGVARSKVKA